MCFIGSSLALVTKTMMLTFYVLPSLGDPLGASNVRRFLCVVVLASSSVFVCCCSLLFVLYDRLLVHLRALFLRSPCRDMGFYRFNDGSRRVRVGPRGAPRGTQRSITGTKPFVVCFSVGFLTTLD